MRALSQCRSAIPGAPRGLTVPRPIPISQAYQVLSASASQSQSQSQSQSKHRSPLRNRSRTMSQPMPSSRLTSVGQSRPMRGRLQPGCRRPKARSKTRRRTLHQKRSRKRRPLPAGHPLDPSAPPRRVGADPCFWQPSSSSKMRLRKTTSRSRPSSCQRPLSRRLPMPPPPPPPKGRHRSQLSHLASHRMR
jgi:hypothetical protein